MFKKIFSLILAIFCQTMPLMVAPIWLNESALEPKSQLITQQQNTQPREYQAAITLEDIKRTQLTRLAAKKAQILQNYGVTEAQIDCQNPDNRQILKRAYSYNLEKDRFLASAEHCLATYPAGCLPNCFDSATTVLIHELIRNNGGDLSQIIIGSCNSLDHTEYTPDTKMFAYCSGLTPKKQFLGINTDCYLVQNLTDHTTTTVSHKGHEISCKLLFTQLIGHELCHIKYQDNLTVTLLSNLLRPNHASPSTNIIITDYEAFCEERADILSVLNCPDPLAVANYLQNNCAEGLYAHRKSPEWQQLINDLRTCLPA